MVRRPSPGVRAAAGPVLVTGGFVVVTALDGPSSDDRFRALIPVAAMVLGLVLPVRGLAAERRAGWRDAAGRDRRPAGP